MRTRAEDAERLKGGDPERATALSPREKERIVAERAFENVQLNYEDWPSSRPRACQRSYRVVALRKNLSKMKGEHVGRSSPPAPTQRCDQENSRMASTPCACRCTTWSATGDAEEPQVGRDDDATAKSVNMEFRLHSLILIPCRVIRQARGLTVRLLGYPPSLDRLFSTWRTIERTVF